MCSLSQAHLQFGTPCHTRGSFRACLRPSTSCGLVSPTYLPRTCRVRGGTDCGAVFPNSGRCSWIAAIMLARRSRGSLSGPNPRQCGACSVCENSCNATHMLPPCIQPAPSRTSFLNRQVLCVAWCPTPETLRPPFPTNAANFTDTIHVPILIPWRARVSSVRRSHPFRLMCSHRRCPRVVACRSPQVRRPLCSGTLLDPLPLFLCLRARLPLPLELGPP